MRFPNLMPLQRLAPLLMVGGVLAFSFTLPSNHFMPASTSTGYGYGGHGCHEADGEGDVDNGHGGKAHTKFDKDTCEDGDNENVQDTDPGDPPQALAQTGRFAVKPAPAATVSSADFISTAITGTTFDDLAHSVTIVGIGTNHGSPVSFTLVAVNGPAGVGNISLVLSDGYVVHGTLLSGSIEVL